MSDVVLDRGLNTHPNTPISPVFTNSYDEYEEEEKKKREEEEKKKSKERLKN